MLLDLNGVWVGLEELEHFVGLFLEIVWDRLHLQLFRWCLNIANFVRFGSEIKTCKTS